MSSPEIAEFGGNAFRPANMRDLISYVSVPDIGLPTEEPELVGFAFDMDEIIDLGDAPLEVPNTETELDELLDEYSAMEWGDEIDLTDASIAEEFADEVVEAATDVAIQASDMQSSEIHNSTHHGENDDSINGPRTGDYGPTPIPPLFPRPNHDKPPNITPPKWGKPRHPEASRKAIPQPSEDHDSEVIHLFTDEIPKAIDPIIEEFERDFEAGSYTKTHTKETQPKRPSLLKLALLKHRYEFETKYFTRHGSDIPRHRILRGNVRYLETRSKTERAHMSSLRRKVGAVAISAISLVAGIGIGAGVVNSHNSESSNNAAQSLVAPNTNANQSISTTETPMTSMTVLRTEKSKQTMPVMSAEQQKAFADMCQWIQENPDQDFVSALNIYTANTAKS